jgi:hypothetical protein
MFIKTFVSFVDIIFSHTSSSINITNIGYCMLILSCAISQIIVVFVLFYILLKMRCRQEI